LGAGIRKPRQKKPIEQLKGVTQVACSVCEKATIKQTSVLPTIRQPTCSRHCNGKLRALELVQHSSKGRAGWTAESHKSYREKMTGEKNPAWKGGVTFKRDKGNYVGPKYVRCPAEFMPMARKDGYVMEHRLVVARALGRCLLRMEAVHHIDHNTRNNSLSNLMLFANNKEHKLYEHHGSPKPLWRG